MLLFPDIYILVSLRFSQQRDKNGDTQRFQNKE